jgi:CheY-like chemotaxis protein
MWKFAERFEGGSGHHFGALPARWPPEENLTSPTGTGPVPGPRPLRIVIADDNPDALSTLGMLLLVVGHDVRVASDGVEAVFVTEAFRPDVVMLDIGMPGMSGLDAARRIRALTWDHDPVLIATTGWNEQADRQRTRDAGFDHHLVKPMDPAALIRLLSTIDRH